MNVRQMAFSCFIPANGNEMVASKPRFPFARRTGGWFRPPPDRPPASGRFGESVRSEAKKCSAFAKIGNAQLMVREETPSAVWAL